MWEWLLLPIDAARAHEVGFYLSWHGRLMTLAWAVLVPIGILAARYYKVTPRQDWPRQLDNKVWWRTHLFCQNTAIVLTLVAVVLIWLARDFRWWSGYHFVLGWAIVVLAIVQGLGGLLRGTKGGPTARAADGSLHGDHYDMTRRRLVFEGVHKVAGYLALVLSAAAVLTGMWRANAPHWMWLALLGWGMVLAVLVRWRMKHHRAIDTYQAIWGPDPVHPGNRPRDA